MDYSWRVIKCKCNRPIEISPLVYGIDPFILGLKGNPKAHNREYICACGKHYYHTGGGYYRDYVTEEMPDNWNDVEVIDLGR